MGDIKEKVGQEQIHGLLFGEKLSWQAIIYDLINTEQLDPWNIDLTILAQKYLKKIKMLEEENFFISSKVLLAAAFLLRIKSEILLEHLPSLDEILFGKKEEKKYIQERIYLDEEIPMLFAKTPLPRFKKVTLDELMSALGKAMTTENRRIRKIIIAKQQAFDASFSIPKKRINIRDQINAVYKKLIEIFSKKEEKLAFSNLSGASTEEKISAFIPLLHLDTQHKIWLEQEEHFGEIWILLKSTYQKQNKEILEKMRKEVEMEDFSEKNQKTVENLDELRNLKNSEIFKS
ncbi:MAG: segregation/condensation protein A [Nanoarchaeota archaeon]